MKVQLTGSPGMSASIWSVSLSSERKFGWMWLVTLNNDTSLWLEEGDEIGDWFCKWRIARSCCLIL